MAKQYSTKDVSKELEVSEQTVRLWSKTFKIPYTKSSGNIRFSQEALEIFETIKALRSENSGFDTIKRHIKKNIKTDNDTQALEPAPEKPKAVEPVQAVDQTEAFVKVIHSLESVIDNSIQKSIKEQNELSERYARATYRIGELETTVKFLKEQVDKLEVEKEKAENKHLKQLEAKDEEILLLKAPPVVEEPEPEPPKGFWQRLFGK